MSTPRNEPIPPRIGINTRNQRLRQHFRPGIRQGSSSVALNYDAANRLTSLTLPNGVAVAYTYDSDQLGGLVHRYDVNGRIAERSGSRAGTSIPIQTRYTY